MSSLDEAAQVALFNRINAVRADAALGLLATGAAPPAQLKLREDLRTRLAWGLVYQLQPLTDTEKADALAVQAATRGVVLSDDVLPFMSPPAPRHALPDPRARSARRLCLGAQAATDRATGAGVAETGAVAWYLAAALRGGRHAGSTVGPSDAPGRHAGAQVPRPALRAGFPAMLVEVAAKGRNSPSPFGGLPRVWLRSRGAPQCARNRLPPAAPEALWSTSAKGWKVRQTFARCAAWRRIGGAEERSGAARARSALRSSISRRHV